MHLFEMFKQDTTDGRRLSGFPQFNYYMKENGDVFNDAFLKCYDTIKDRDYDEITTIKYFGAALSNNFRKEQKRTSEFLDIYGVNEVDICCEELHNESKYELCDIINESVKKKFGERKHRAWKLHFMDGYTYEDLIEMGYDDINFHNLFRQINSYVKDKLPKENEDYKKLLKKLYYI